MSIRIALVHDWLLRMGGAERVLFALHKMFPEAPIYTFLFDQEKIGAFFPDAEIRPSFLQKAPSFLRARHKYFLPLMPIVPETIDLSEFDLVISSSSAFAKGVITRAKTIHVCYCHSPMRFVWDWHHNYFKEQFENSSWYWPERISRNMFTGIFSRMFTHYVRMWDKSSANRVDYFIANSRTTQERVEKFYRCESEVIYPPVSIKNIPNIKETVNNPLSYFLIVSQLTPYKRIDIAIKAFNKLELPLVIAGDGSDRKRLEKIAGPTIRFVGFRPDEVIDRLYSNCAAFIFPGEDDFGIAPVEAMAHGKPVLAYRKGGLRESMIEGLTGEFFDDAYPEILADGVRRLLDNYSNYNPMVIRKRAEKFSEERFENEFKFFLKKALKTL